MQSKLYICLGSEERGESSGHNIRTIVDPRGNVSKTMSTLITQQRMTRTISLHRNKEAAVERHPTEQVKANLILMPIGWKDRNPIHATSLAPFQ